VTNRPDKKYSGKLNGDTVNGQPEVFGRLDGATTNVGLLSQYAAKTNGSFLGRFAHKLSRLFDILFATQQLMTNVVTT